VIDEFLNQTGNRHKYFPQTTDLPSQEAPTESLEKKKIFKRKDAILVLQCINNMAKYKRCGFS